MLRAHLRGRQHRAADDPRPHIGDAPGNYVYLLRGLQNFAGNLSGVAAPVLTGYVVERTGHFFWAFALAAAVALTGAMVYLFVLGDVEPARWRHQASA